MAITGAQLLEIVCKGVADARRAREQLGHFHFVRVSFRGKNVPEAAVKTPESCALASAIVNASRQWASSPFSKWSGTSFITEGRHFTSGLKTSVLLDSI
jgi:hypothetical protein